jgi:anti-sigma factor RsiW
MKVASAFPVGEAELQAYVDRRESVERRAAIEAWLAAHPEDAQRVAAYRLLAERCREAYAPVLDEPVPEALLAVLHRAPPRRARLLHAAVVAVAVVLAFFLALFLVPEPPSEIVRRAEVAHAVYAAEVLHPVEARARKELLDWLSARLHMEVKVPELGTAGLAFIGGRLLPGDNAVAALLMYEGQNGQRVTFYWGPEFRRPEDTGLRFAHGERGTRVYYWLDDECGYAVASSDLSQKELLVVALMAHAQLEK